MPTIRSRLGMIASLSITALLLLTVGTVVMTFAREKLRQPRPWLRVNAMRVFPVVQSTEMVILPSSPLLRALSPYFRNGTLETNVRPTTKTAPRDSEKNLTRPSTTTDPTEGHRSTKDPNLPSSFMINNKVNLKLQQAVMGICTVDNIALDVSAEMNFSECWDWNTKAIYIAFIAQYATPRGQKNEGIFLDVILRDGRPPSLIHRLIRYVLELLFPKEAISWQENEKEHDAEGTFIDHKKKHVRLNKSMKYYVKDLYANTLEREMIKISVRYQVIGHFGWVPTRELHAEFPVQFKNTISRE
ncbi:unnamed protein product [Phytomonas sp. Hart1]|nr:unnamed protein product [Phytomonas sp. Hart1]|eukprot:CCW72195.1 unnamed protein product [Phytomonas sp. isolate Hart1]